FMAVDALTELAAQAQAARRIELDETARLDGEADIADGRADILLLTLAAQRDRRAEIDAAVLAEQDDADALILRRERHRRSFAPEAEDRHRKDAVGIGARIFGQGLGAKP